MTHINTSNINQYEDIFKTTTHSVQIKLAEISGNNDQERTINIALLLLIGYWLSNQTTLATHIVRKTCATYGCLDAPHFMRTLKQATDLFAITGTRRAYSLKLTDHGRARGQALLDSQQQTINESKINMLLVSRKNASPVQFEMANSGFELTMADSAETAIQSMKSNGLPDVILIDGCSSFLREGQALCRRLGKFSDLPIVVFTNPANESRAENLFNSHIYVISDHALPAACLAQEIHKLINEIGQLPFKSSPEIKVDHQLRIDFIDRTAYVENEAVSLTPLETRILFMLIRQNGQTVSDEFICERLGLSLEDPGIKQNLTVYISRLRRKLTTQDGINYIRPQYGTGYRFFSPLSTAPAA